MLYKHNLESKNQTGFKPKTEWDPHFKNTNYKPTFISYIYFLTTKYLKILFINRIIQKNNYPNILLSKTLKLSDILS